MQFVPLLLLGSHQDQHQICADGEIHRLVGDDHGVEICLQSFQALVEHRDQVRTDGVHLGVKFAAHHAVAEIDQARSGIALDFAAGIFQRLENDDAFRLFDFFRCAAANIEKDRGTFFRFVKPFPPARQNFLDNRWKCSPFFLHLSREGLDANRIDDLERTEFPGEAPAHRAVNVDHVIGNLRHTTRGVQTHFRKGAPQKLLSFVTLLPFQHGTHQRAQPLPCVLDGFAHFERGKLRLLPRAVFHGVHIEGQNFLFAFALHLLVKTLASLVAEPAALGHFLHQHWNFVHFPRLIIGRGFVNILYHMHQHIETHYVCRAKRGGLWPAHSRSRAGVHFFHGHAQSAHQAQRIQHGKCSDAVGDKIRRVLRYHHAFAQPPVAEFAQCLDHLRRCFRPRDHFHQFQIARRIEEMRPRPMLLKFFAHALGN